MKFLGFNVSTCHVGKTPYSSSGTHIDLETRIKAPTWLALRYYTEYRFSIHTRRCEAYVTLLPHLRGMVKLHAWVHKKFARNIAITTTTLKLPQRAPTTGLRTYYPLEFFWNICFQRFSWYQITCSPVSWQESLQVSSLQTQACSLSSNT